MKFTVDTRNRDFINSLTDQTSAAIPALTLGDKFPVSFEFGKDGAIDESIGALDTVEVALSSCVTPDRGTFRLFPPGGPITGEPITIPATVGDRTLKSMIAAAWDGVSISDLCITGANGFFRVEFQGNLADTEIDAMTGDGTKLSPRSVVSVNQKEAGGGGQNAVQIISLDSVPLAYADDLTFDDGVFSGILNVDTVAANEAMREAGKGRVSRLLSVRVTDDEGNRTTYAKRPVTVDCTGIPMGPFGGGSLAQYITLQQGDNRYDRTLVDVTRFGAVAGGDPMQTAERIQDAIDIAALQRGAVYIPSSDDEWIIGKGLILKQGLSGFIGAGRSATIIKLANNSPLTLRTLLAIKSLHFEDITGAGESSSIASVIITDPEGTSDIEISGFTLDCNGEEQQWAKDGPTDLNIIGLHLYATNRVHLSDIYVKDAFAWIGTDAPHSDKTSVGILCHNASNVTGERLEVEKSGYECFGFRNRARHCYFRDIVSGPANRHAVALQPNANWIYIDGFYVEQDGTGRIFQQHSCYHAFIRNGRGVNGQPMRLFSSGNPDRYDDPAKLTVIEDVDFEWKLGSGPNSEAFTLIGFDKLVLKNVNVVRPGQRVIGGSPDQGECKVDIYGGRLSGNHIWRLGSSPVVSPELTMVNVRGVSGSLAIWGGENIAERIHLSANCRFSVTAGVTCVRIDGAGSRLSAENCHALATSASAWRATGGAKMILSNSTAETSGRCYHAEGSGTVLHALSCEAKGSGTATDAEGGATLETVLLIDSTT